MSSENPALPAQEPGMSPTPGPVMSQPPNVGCPNCFTIVPAGTAYCPKCGNSIPPYPGISAAPPIPPRRPRTRLIIGILLIFLIFLGGLSYVVYVNHQQNQLLLQTAKNMEQAAANQAPDQIRFTCFSVTPDSSHLTYDQASHTYSGYALISEEFGLTNPTRFPIDATWTMTIDLTAVNILSSSTTPFHLAANEGAKPIFAFQITAAQYNSLPSNPDFSKFTTTLTATYSVTGTYATYHLTEHSTYDSTTGRGTGTLASSVNIVPC